MMGMMMGILVVELVFRWWSKCISSVISRAASRNILFSSARISKTLNVDRVCPPNDDSQDDTQFDDLSSSSDGSSVSCAA